MPASGQLTPTLNGPADFGAFYDDALPHVYGYFLRRCRYDRSLAEDLTQDAFLAAVREVQRGTRVDNPMPWMYGIARHTLANWQRSGKVLTSALPPDLPGGSDPADGTVDRVATDALLATLHPDQRRAVSLRYLDDLPVAAVAARMGRSEHAVESLLGRARRALRRTFEETNR